MVSTNDLILTGGLLLGVLYLKKRSDQVSTIAPTDYYQQVQEVNIQRLGEFGSRIEQLKDIRSQILGYEKGIAEEQVSFLGSEIGKAQQVGSAAQAIVTRLSAAAPKLGYGPTFVTQKTAQYISEAGSNLQLAFNRLIGIGDYSRAQVIANLAELRQQREVLAQSQEFIAQAQQQQADIMAKYSELEQIV